jgi:hypothetical protein
VRSLSPAVETYLAVLAARVAAALGQNLVGTYLHGSAALGGFRPGQSDIDILVVVHRGLAAAERERLGTQLHGTALPVPAATLELSVVTLDTTRHPVAAPLYEMHINTRNARYADGRGKTDPDLVLHFPVVRQSGRLLGAGLPVADVVAPVPRDLVLPAMATELDDALNSSLAKPEYILLNACRNLAYLSDGALRSKLDGGRWALEHAPEIEPSLIRAALRRQDGTDPDAPVDVPALRQTARRIADTLRTATA